MKYKRLSNIFKVTRLGSGGTGNQNRCITLSLQVSYGVKEPRGKEQAGRPPTQPPTSPVIIPGNGANKLAVRPTSAEDSKVRGQQQQGARRKPRTKVLAVCLFA